MKRFVSRLDRVLRQRTLAERQQAAALGEAMREEEKHRRQLEEAKERLERCGDQVIESTKSHPPAGLLQNLGLAKNAAASSAAEAADSHRRAESMVDGQRKELEMARMKRRAVERLRERQQADWNTEAARKEQKEIDDLAQRRNAKEKP